MSNCHEHNEPEEAALKGPIASNVQGTEDTEVGKLLRAKRDLQADEQPEAAEQVQDKLRDRVMRNLNEMDGDYKSMK